jgi:hypothetical protein
MKSGSPAKAVQATAKSGKSHEAKVAAIQKTLLRDLDHVFRELAK